MKRSVTSFFAIVMVAATFSACEKADSPEPKCQTVDELRKGGGGETAPITTATTTYGGRATGIDATIWGSQNGTVTSNQTTFADTYMLTASGSALSASAVQAQIPNILTSGALSASAAGQSNSTNSTASVNSLNITINGNTITADHVQATATTGCGAIPAGTVQITNLKLNGNPVNVNGSASQAVYLPGGGMMILNLRSGAKKGNSYNMSVTAIHINVPNKADIKVAAASAETKC